MLDVNSLIDTVDVSPLLFWKDSQHRFPALTSLAQDVLSIPATGAGVERLFNTARDICHYRRGRLNATTIQELMMFLCTSRFDIQEEQYTFLQEFFSRDEIEAANEEINSTAATANTYDLDPISDTEEDGVIQETGDRDDYEAQQAPISNDETDPPLPESKEALKCVHQ